MKLPSRPLVISSPIPISLLPTALLQDRMQILLNAYLSLPIIKSNPSPFSLVMGPTRVVEAFLLHYDSHPGLLHNSNSISGNNGRFNANGNHLGGHNDRAEEGMFEQSIIQLDQSPYPLKLSHPKYTAASQKRAAAAAASAPPSGGNDHAAAGISINKDQNRARAESSGVPSTPNFTSSSSLSSLSASSALAAGNETGTSPAKSVNITHATPASQPHTTGHVNDSSNESSLTIPQPSSSTSSTTTAMQHHRYNAQQYNQYNQRQMFHHSAAAGRTVKPLLHTRAKDIPPAVSLSEGFAVRLADEKDDLRVSSFFTSGLFTWRSSEVERGTLISLYFHSPQDTRLTLSSLLAHFGPYSRRKCRKESTSKSNVKQISLDLPHLFSIITRSFFDSWIPHYRT